MLDIERYTGIRCPCIHLQLYNAIMHGHELDEAHMIMLFPLSLSGATQRWFAYWTLRDVGVMPQKYPIIFIIILLYIPGMN